MVCFIVGSALLRLNCEHPVPIRLQDLDQAADLGDTDIVVENVDAVVSGDTGFDHRSDVSGFACLAVGPIDPAPTTSATLPLSRSAMSVLLLGRVKSDEQHHTTSMGMGVVVHHNSPVSGLLNLVPDAGSVPSWIDS